MHAKKSSFIVVCCCLLIGYSMVFSGDKKQAPEINARDINGKQIVLKTLLEKGPVLVWFWNSCCGNKKPQTEALKNIYAKYNPQGFEILGISEDGAKKMASTKQFVAVNKLTFPIIMDNSMKTLNQFQGFAVPSVYLITKEGLIQYYKSGYLPGDETALEKEISALLPKKE